MLPDPSRPDTAVGKKKKKRKSVGDGAGKLEDESTGENAIATKKRAIAEVETVIDPSTITSKSSAGDGKKRNKKDLEEDEAFRDSRGIRKSDLSSRLGPMNYSVRAWLAVPVSVIFEEAFFRVSH